MTLALLGFGMVISFMVLIMRRMVSPVVALIAVPLIFAVVGGFAGPDLGAMMLDGLTTLAPTAAMLMFAILYFGIMIDVGLFDPIVKTILRLVGGDPLKVVVGTALLAAVVSLDGDGSTTYMVTIGAMLPLYRKLGLNILNLTCVTILASGVMNLTPWGGPLARAASALQLDPAEIFVSIMPLMGAGLLTVGGIAWRLGILERRRLGTVCFEGSSAQCVSAIEHSVISPADNQPDADVCLADNDVARARSRRRRLLFNAGLTALLMAALIAAILPIPILFMIAFALALWVNFPDADEQRRRVASHAANVVGVVSLVLAAGVFTGILNGTGMVGAMSRSFLAVMPEAWGPYLAPITALASMPFTFFLSNDAFYFGVLPVLAEAGNGYGISPADMAVASLIGQPIHLLSPLVPSTYLLVGLAGVEFGDHQRFTLKWALAVCLAMLAAGLLWGIVPLVA